MTIDELAELDDDAYFEAINEAMWGRTDWVIFLEPDLVDRTCDVLDDVKTSIGQQLHRADEFQNGGNPEWRGKTDALYRRIKLHLREANREAQRLDKEEYERSAVKELGQWRNLARALAGLVDDSPILDEMYVPTDGRSVRQWLEGVAA